MEQRELLQTILDRLNEITGKTDPAAPGQLEPAVFRRLDQVAKIVSSIQRYLPKRVIDKILLNPDGVKVEGERRPVTVLFGDLSGFTAMSETMDPEQVVEVVNQYFDTMVEIAERYGGHIDKFMGDALMVLFGAPVVHEDDSLRACLAAIEMLEAMDRFSAERKMDLAMSIGLNTGEVVALNVGSKSRMEYTVIGDGVNLASRLEKVATARQCVIGENTYRQVKGKIRLKKLKPVMVKGKAKPQNVYLILGRVETAEAAAGLRAGSIPMIGRMAEMDAIRAAVGRAKNGAGQVVAITGGPGLGKSRLAKELELLARDERFTFAKGKCYSYAAGMAYLPFLRQLHSLLGVQEKDAPAKKKEKLVERLQSLDLSDFEPFLGSLLGIASPEIGDLDPEKRKRKTFEGFTSLFHKESARQPLALAFEDLQWADSLSLELLEHVVETVGDKPIILCCDYRPELALPFIAQPYCTSIVLDPLGQREVFQMMSALAGVTDVSDQVLGKVTERTEGNPLFVEEIIRHLLSRRLVKREGENLIAAKRFGTMALPNTVAGVVLGRIDKLSEDLRRTLQYAAVIGKEFDRDMLAHITKTAADQLQPQLDNLEHFEGLLYSKELESKRLYQFHSTTTQEAAYSTLLKGRRQELHGGVAQTYERDYRDNLEPWLEDLAHHYYNSKYEDKAVHYLQKAGDKARGLYANSEALRYYDQTMAVLKKGKPTKERVAALAEVIFKDGGINRLLGKRDLALQRFNKSHRLAKQTGDAHAQRVYILESAIVLDMLGDVAKAAAILEAAIAQSASEGDTVTHARSLMNRGNIFMREGNLGKALDHFTTAQSLFEMTGDVKQVIKINGSIAYAKELSGDVPGAVDHYQKALSISRENNYIEGMALYNNNLGNCFLMMGDIDKASRLFPEALALSQRIGDRRVESLSSGSIGMMKAFSGDYDDAMISFESSLRIARQIGEITQQMNMLGNIGSIHQIRGDFGKAIEYHRHCADLAEQLSDLGSLVEPLRNLGIDYALRGEYATALQTLTTSANHAAQIGDPRMIAFVKSCLGHIAMCLGQIDCANADLSKAMDLAKQVGDPELLLFVARNLSELKLATGDFTAAAGLAEKGIHLSQDTNNRRELALALSTIATLFAQQKDWDKMAESHAEALELARTVGDQMLLTRLYLLSAGKATQTGAHKDAEQYLDDALELSQKVGSPDLLWQVHYRRGELLRAQGLDQQAKEFFTKARETVESMKLQVPEGMWEGFINNTERKLVYKTQE